MFSTSAREGGTDTKRWLSQPPQAGRSRELTALIQISPHRTAQQDGDGIWNRTASLLRWATAEDPSAINIRPLQERMTELTPKHGQR